MSVRSLDWNAGMVNYTIYQRSRAKDGDNIMTGLNCFSFFRLVRYAPKRYGATDKDAD